MWMGSWDGGAQKPVPRSIADCGLLPSPGPSAFDAPVTDFLRTESDPADGARVRAPPIAHCQGFGIGSDDGQKRAVACGCVWRKARIEWISPPQTLKASNVIRAFPGS